MKLIIVGATGLVGSELVKKSLHNPLFTSIIAISRRPITVQSNDSRLHNVILNDYGQYSESVKNELTGAAVCIWTVAVTPFKTSGLDFEEIKRVCQTCTMAGFEAIHESAPIKPFRFIYFSAEGTPEDPAQAPRMMADYQKMRSETEAMVRNLPEQYQDSQVWIVRPGFVTASTSWTRSIAGRVFAMTNLLTRAIPNITRDELVAAVLREAVQSHGKEVLSNQELVSIGQQALKTAGITK